MGTLVNGIKEIFATSQSTATHLPVCASDGTPQGRISVGDLASVLGGVMPRALTSQETPNDITKTGVYIASGQTGLPYGYGVLTHIATVTRGTGYNAVQTFYKWDASQSWQRTKVDGTWKEWIEIALSIPSFYKNYSDLAALANAAGAIYFLGDLSGRDIIESVNYTTWAAYASTPHASLPSSFSYGYIVRVRGLIFAFDHNSLKVWFKSFFNQTWSDWAAIN